jgi:hypothetical protein
MACGHPADVFLARPILPNAGPEQLLSLAVPVTQYVYFELSGRSISATEMATILGLEPDEITVRGSRVAQPDAIPVLHRWKIVCREPGLRVDEQIARVLERIAPHTAAIGLLAGRLDTEDQGPAAVLESCAT